MKSNRFSRLSILWSSILLGSVVPQTAGFGRASAQSMHPVHSEATHLDSAALSGLRFRNIGPANMSGRIVDIAVVESDPYTFYAAAATGGLWKTTNNGVTFQPVFEHEGTHSIGAVAVHPRNTGTVWVGTGERANRQSSSWGDGVYKSTDGGKTWTNMGLRDSLHIGRIVLHPKNPDIVYVAAMGHLWGPNEERGLYKTVDGGQTWDRILYLDPNTGIVDVAMDPSNPEILYAAAYQRRRKAFGFHGGGPKSGLYRSTDGGKTWTALTDGLPQGDMGRIGISIYRKDPRIVYVCVEQGLRYTASTSYEERKAGIYRSEDRGESWKFMGDWNPRPMYASQILVDPNNDQRIYMMNQFSFSDDGGKTFKAPRQSVHSDDRILWVDPYDSRHLIKGSDGALAISYDRGITWLFAASLPVSQYYRIAVDMRKPFRVYGGLQDNGSWVGPSATYRLEGILNEDWIRLGGGDGFLNLVDPTDDNRVYVESQYLGLTRVNLETNEVQTIRPNNTQGYISSRRNWDTWGTGKPFPLLGNQMEPANWDGPFIISPHEHNTLYAGTEQLWKSTDGGYSWMSFGNVTTGVDRSKLTIMNQVPAADTPSLDDGVPYYPTLTAISESPLKPGLLYVGADDGSFQVSRDGGVTWKRLDDRFPGLPEHTWVSGIEASRYEVGTVYAAFDGHRSDDYLNHLYKSTDSGQTWSSIVGDLPANRVLRTIHEDLKNPRLLYVAAELGFFVSIDGGRHWIEWKSNLPTIAINDFVIHPRDNDLVLATHGRGVWILDNMDSLQELTSEILASPAHLFTIEPGEMIRYTGLKAQSGDMIFRGANPPAGVIIDYYLREEQSDGLTLAIYDDSGTEIRRLQTESRRGINRVIWDLRYPHLPKPVGAGPDRFGNPRSGPQGPFVNPGTYRVTLSVNGKSYKQRFQVKDDPRIRIGIAERRSWTQTLRRIGGLYSSTNALVERTIKLQAKLKTGTGLPPGQAGEVARLQTLLVELRRRIQVLYEQVSRWTGSPTEDQNRQVAYFFDVENQLRSRLEDQVNPKPE